jgi:cyclase
MLTKRIIPCLDVKDGRTVKGINFKSLRDAGDPVELGALYSNQGADELVFLDITATIERRKTLLDLVRRIGERINIPFTVGGGIKSIEEIDALLHAGADKVSLNSSIVSNPDLINEAFQAYGAQCLVAAIDARKKGDSWEVYVAGGTKPTGLDVIAWAKEVEQRGVGEILLTSMDADGTKAGFDLDLLQAVDAAVRIPVIASGGAGTITHCIDAIQKGKADAVLAASIFHFKEIEISDLKVAMKSDGIAVRTVTL